MYICAYVDIKVKQIIIAIKCVCMCQLSYSFRNSSTAYVIFMLLTYEKMKTFLCIQSYIHTLLICLLLLVHNFCNLFTQVMAICV